MTLRKDDPVYYKCAINNLIKQAQAEGLTLGIDINRGEVNIYFKADNGDTAAIEIPDRN